MLREWSVAEQRYRAVLEVLDGATVTMVAPAVRGHAADGACVAAPVCRGRWGGEPG